MDDPLLPIMVIFNITFMSMDIKLMLPEHLLLIVLRDLLRITDVLVRNSILFFHCRLVLSCRGGLFLCDRPLGFFLRRRREGIQPNIFINLVLA